MVLPFAIKRSSFTDVRIAFSLFTQSKSGSGGISQIQFVIFRSMTIFAESNVDVDLRMLRSFRVLRPLKLVSRIPSKKTATTDELPYLFFSVKVLSLSNPTIP